MSFSKINFTNKIVFIRVDYNVPFIGKTIQDNSRIIASIPTIKKIISNKGKVVIVSHLGRPKSKKNPLLSLKNILHVLEKNISLKIKFLEKHPKNYNYNYIKNSEEKIFLLENIRFYKEEKTCDKIFAQHLASLADVYINDAFSVSHRKHSSVFTICDFFKEKYFGPLFKKEINEISRFIKNPIRPTTFVFGGSKLSTKIKTINNIINYADNIIIGGAMSFPFIKSKGFEILKSKCETGCVEDASVIIKKCLEKKVNLHLPVDIVFTNNIDSPSFIKTIKIENIVNQKKNLIGVDIGGLTCKNYSSIIDDSFSVVWNGPMGVFEKDVFMKGTKKIASAVANMDINKKISLVGGGDTVSAIKKLDLQNKFSYVSMGGGAILDFLSKEKLPVFKKFN
tara:strand:- start:2497 stop:3681 length:1185 start_codon:yes stop_codon:yes gene_type:complete